MGARDEFRAAIEAGDIQAVQRISRAAEPHLPAMSDADAELVIHQTRVRSESISFPKRAWSHRWLTERGHESGLPDHLKPKADQVCPVIVSAVGIALSTTSKILASAMPEIRQAMEDAVLDAQAHGKLEDSAFVRARMLEAKTRRVRELFGSASYGQGR